MLVTRPTSGSSPEPLAGSGRRTALRSLPSLLLLVAVISGCAGTRGPLDESQLPPEPDTASSAEYRLGEGDILTVNVWKNPDLLVRVPVRPDGFISVPLAGDVRAGGRTPNEVAAETEQLLARFIRTPQVSVIVEELNSAEFKNRVRVVGGVETPTSIAHRDGMTVIDLVLEAGGTTDFANGNLARLIRTVDGVTGNYPIYVDDILDGGDVDTNYRLFPGDVVSIPERRF